MKRTLIFLSAICLLSCMVQASELIIFSNETPLIRCECKEESKHFGTTTYTHASESLATYLSSGCPYLTEVNGIPTISVTIQAFDVEGLTSLSHRLAFRKGNGFNERKDSFCFVSTILEDDTGVHYSLEYRPDSYKRSSECTNHWFE